MKTIMILGSFPKDDERTKLYRTITAVAQKYVSEVSSPIDSASCEGTAEDRYNRAFRKVGEADFVIGEQSEPSTGQGMELRECAALDIPFIVVAREGSKVSGMMKGCPQCKEIMYYTDNQDLQEKLEKYFATQNV